MDHKKHIEIANKIVRLKYEDTLNGQKTFMILDILEQLNNEIFEISKDAIANGGK